MGFFQPKMLWDFLTKALDKVVSPIPFLQLVNLVFSLLVAMLEWPLQQVAGSVVHRSIVVRLAILPVAALTALLMYQAADAALYYMVGFAMYIRAYRENEVCFFSTQTYTPTLKVQ